MQEEQIAEASKPCEAKCPYLAGRPPHGTYKLWPSSINVCYGRARDDKGYGPVSKETQEKRCLAGHDAYADCQDYLDATALSIDPPAFGRALTADEGAAANDRVRRVRRRRLKKHRRRFPLAALLRVLIYSAVILATAAVMVLVLKGDSRPTTDDRRPTTEDESGGSSAVILPIRPIRPIRPGV